MLAVDKWFDTITEVDKTYDLRIYETHFIISISKDKGGEMQEVQTEIRAIPKVTIVRTLAYLALLAIECWLKSPLSLLCLVKSHELNIEIKS